MASSEMCCADTIASPNWHDSCTDGAKPVPRSRTTVPPSSGPSEGSARETVSGTR